MIYYNVKRQIYINLNVNKKFDIETIIYHVKKNFCNENYSSRFAIKFILFLSRFLSFAKIKYWSIELKFVDIIWILKKIKYLIKFSFLSIVVYTNHDIVLRLTKQTILITFSTNKTNFRFIRVNDYIQRFELQICHKFDKIHIVLNILFKLVNLNKKLNFFAKNELNILFILTNINIKSSSTKKMLFINFLTKMNFAFRQKIFDDYQINIKWKRIIDVLDIKNNVKFFFCRKKYKLIFRFDNDIFTTNYVFVFRRFCVSNTIVKNVFETIHDDSNDHFNYVKNYEHIVLFWYIRELTRRFREYLNHCFDC